MTVDEFLAVCDERKLKVTVGDSGLVLRGPKAEATEALVAVAKRLKPKLLERLAPAVATAPVQRDLPTAEPEHKPDGEITKRIVLLDATGNVEQVLAEGGDDMDLPTELDRHYRRHLRPVAAEKLSEFWPGRWMRWLVRETHVRKFGMECGIK